MASKQNIIYIYFKGKHLTISKSQYQYNHGQFLYFADLDLPQTFEVHFSNRDRGESKPQIGSNKLVEIPDEYFWSGALQIYAWIYLHSGADDGETVYEVKIPLMKRAKPTDEEPLPQQQGVIDRAIAELNNAIEITTENANKTNADKTIVNNIKDEVVVLKDEIDSTATTINQKAQEAIAASERAETSAQNAATSERKALDYAQQADQSAQSALESKNVAQQKAEVATNASSEALGYRNEALEAKNQAVQAKQNIVDYRNETKEYRDETLNLKNNVQTLKNQIDETAEEIDETASTVRDDAESANRSALSANESASQATQSANSANESKNQANTYKNDAKEYRDQAEEFKNQSEANVTHYPKIIDDYWYVWDATNEEYINTNVDANGIKGDTGNGIESITLNDDYTLTIAFTDGTSHTTSSIRGEKGDTGESGVYIGTDEPTNENIHVWIDTDDDGTSEDLVADIADLQETNKKIFNTYPTKTVSGAIATFDDSVEGLPLKELTIDINPVQDLHGYKSPWIGGARKNLLNLNRSTIVDSGSHPRLEPKEFNEDQIWVGLSFNDYFIPSRVSKYNIAEDTVSLTITSSAYGIGFPIKCEAETSYAISQLVVSDENICFGIGFYDETGTYISSQSQAVSKVFTTPSTCEWLVVVFAPKNAQVETTYTKPQLEKGSTITDYTPYENICPITGWTGANVTATNTNLRGGIDLANDIRARITSAVIDTEEKTISYKYNASITAGVIVPQIKFKENTRYTFIFTLSNPNMARANLRIYYTDGTYTQFPDLGAVGIKQTVVVVSSANKTVSTISKTSQGGTTKLYYDESGIFEGVLTVNDFEPFGRLIPISWQSEVGAIYGGQIDVLNGVLTITHDFINLGNLTWNYRSDRDCFESKVIPKAQHSNNTLTITCDCFTPVTNRPSETKLDNVIYFNSTSGVRGTSFRIRCTSLNGDVEAFKELITGHYATYLMYTTDWIETQLTPHEIDSLLGQNNIWADTGNSYVTYRVDPQKYINEQISEIPVQDVQINDVSIVQDGVAKIPTASENNAGVVKVDVFTNGSYEGGVVTANNKLYVVGSSLNSIKSGWDYGKPIVAGNQHMSTFYGLAKAAGHDEKDSELPIGQYTDEAKASIKNMLGVDDVKKDDVYDTYVTDTATGTISSFEDGADDVPIKSLTVTLEPQQDFNGYDKPWVGGGGINLNPREWVSESTSAANRYYIVSNLSLTAGTYYVRAEISDGNAYVVGLYMSIDGGSNNRIGDNGSTPIVRNFTLENDAVVSIYLHCSTTPDGVQARSSVSKTRIDEYIPYENICPISGWTGMQIQHTGKNLLPLNIWKLPYNRAVGNVIEPIPTDRSWTQEDGKITYVTTSMYTDVGLMTPLLPAGTYFYTLEKFSSGTLRCTNYILDKNFKIVQMSNSSNVGSRYHITRVLEEEGYIAIKLDNGTTASQTIELEAQITYSDTELPYEPYNGTTIPINWQTEAGTVYGGKLDVSNGVLTVNNYYCTPDNATQIRYGINTESNLPYAYLSFPRKAIGTGLAGKTLCSMYTAGSEQNVNKTLRMWTSEADIWDSDLDVTSLDTVKAYFADLVIVYPLETPIEIQLSPTEIKSLLGQNNIFADTGNTEVEYRADTKLYINKKITEAISALT